MVISDPDDLHRAFQLRYKVFCEQMKAIPEKSTGMISDFYDYGNTIHIMSDCGNGYVRIINKPNDYLLPFEEKTQLMFSHKDRVSEISQLCVDREVKNKRPVIEQLFNGIVEAFDKYDRQIACAIMEPWLIGVLGRMYGVHFESKTHYTVEYYGERQPVWGNFRKVSENWRTR